jgi:hypothetical protein
MTSKKDVLLLNAAQRGDLTQLKAILAQGANVDECDRDGTTALMFAANYRDCARTARRRCNPQPAQKTVWFDRVNVGSS